MADMLKNAHSLRCLRMHILVELSLEPRNNHNKFVLTVLSFQYRAISLNLAFKTKTFPQLIHKTDSMVSKLWIVQLSEN